MDAGRGAAAATVSIAASKLRACDSAATSRSSLRVQEAPAIPATRPASRAEATHACAESVDLCMVDPAEVARQLCLIDYAMFHQASHLQMTSAGRAACLMRCATQIRANECLGSAWTKKATKHLLAPHIVAVSTRFNAVRGLGQRSGCYFSLIVSGCAWQVARWVAFEVLRHDSPQARARTLEHAIAIAEVCVRVQRPVYALCAHVPAPQACCAACNFHSAYCVFSGVSDVSVKRLRLTWEVRRGLRSAGWLRASHLHCVAGRTAVHQLVAGDGGAVFPADEHAPLAQETARIVSTMHTVPRFATPAAAAPPYCSLAASLRRRHLLVGLGDVGHGTGRSHPLRQPDCG